MEPRAEGHWLSSLLCGAGGLLLAVCVTQPVAREGVGSATSIHELFDLLLAGNLHIGVSRWVGLFGYVPALGGALVLVAEALTGRARWALRLIGFGTAAAAMTVLTLGGPWTRIHDLGVGLWLGLLGVATVALGIAAELWLVRRTDRQTPTKTPRTSSDPNRSITHVVPTLRT